MEMMDRISDLEKKIESLEAIIKSQQTQIDEKDALLKWYEEQFKLSQRKQFGSSSELSPDQLRFENMFNEAEDQADPSLPEPTYEEITYKRQKRSGKREDDLDGLPIERIDYELQESERGCPECGEVMSDIGVTIRHELKVVPAQVIHVEHATHAYGCPKCNKDGDRAQIIRADSPFPLIAGSLASPSVVAHIASQKYVNGIPLYRSEKGFGYDGVVLSRQTMSNWLIFCAQTYLTAIYALLVTFFLKETVCHADETTVQVLHEPGREAKTKSYEWIYRTSQCSEHKIVIYEYQETRNHEHALEFLKGFTGYLHCDGYQGYHKMPADIIIVGCWSHARRYWEKLYESIAKAKRDGSNAERGLVYINVLFAYEHEFRDLAPEERCKQRLKLSKPVSDDFFDWVETIQALPKSLLGEAVTYALLQRTYLENVYLDGRLEFSNNAAERAVKPFVQGRKQWLFSNTPNGAESSSIYYTIIETAKENNLNPFQYVKFLLEMLPNSTSSEVESLLPWSESLPERCRVPVKESNIKPAKPMYSGPKGPLRNALQKLRKRYEEKDAEPG
jgi:transposase